MHLFAFKQEIHHLLFQQLAMLRVHHVELFLVDKHGLLLLPLRPGFFRDFVIDTLTQFARIELEILAFGVALKKSTKNGSAHRQSS
ncbi:hypothetical protein BN129_2567 [Cronobacter sakazakii 701]|nr:hypothetical protein BN129_2567 [Cronobacter sakazakii 701]